MAANAGFGIYGVMRNRVYIEIVFSLCCQNLRPKPNNRRKKNTNVSKSE